jgi:hypothetical protein
VTVTDTDFVEFSAYAALWLLLSSLRQAVRDGAATVGAVEVLTAAATPHGIRTVTTNGPWSRAAPGTPPRPTADPQETLHAARVADVSPASRFESVAIVREILRMAHRPWAGPEAPVPAVGEDLLHALGVALELARQRGERCASRRDVLLALVAHTDALGRQLISADVLAEWMRITRDYVEIPYAPAISSLETYGFVRLPGFLDIMSWPERRSADRAMGVKGARAVVVMQFEAVRQAIRVGDADVGLDHLLLALASVGHQVASKVAGTEPDSYWKSLGGSDPDRIWTSATYLRSAGLAYGDAFGRLATTRAPGGLTASTVGQLRPGSSAEATELLKALPPLVSKGSGDAQLVQALITIAPERVAEVVRQLGGDPEPLLALKAR